MLGCIHPISSPMMNRILGFCCCCAAAGEPTTETAANDASRPSQILLAFIALFPQLLKCGCPRRAGSLSPVDTLSAKLTMLDAQRRRGACDGHCYGAKPAEFMQFT